MTCRDVLDRIEAIAAGEEPAPSEMRAHLEGCLRCAAALATARRIEEALATRPAPAAPPRFTASVAARIRDERWRSEQHVDRLFNIVLMMGVLAIAAGAFALLNLHAAAAAFTASVALLNQIVAGLLIRAVPSLSTYVIAAGFLATTLLVWWWAERKLSL
jgi:anti-sigma factor RsiW